MSTREEMVREFMLEGDHACLTGDCLHQKQAECFEDAYLAGLDAGTARLRVLEGALRTAVTRFGMLATGHSGASAAVGAKEAREALEGSAPAECAGCQTGSPCIGGKDCSSNHYPQSAKRNAPTQGKDS